MLHLSNKIHAFRAEPLCRQIGVATAHKEDGSRDEATDLLFKGRSWGFSALKALLMDRAIMNGLSPPIFSPPTTH